MLTQLYIKDFALIDELTIAFGPGLNILTGETGAGKSIIIGALSLLLGVRTKTDVIRKGASKAVAEGQFDMSLLAPGSVLQDMLDEGSDEMLLRREVHQNGRTRAFINDSPISNTQLASIGDLLIDLHGQHEHQSLLKTERHISYLDNYGIDRVLLSQIKDSYKTFRSLNQKLDALRQKNQLLREKQELLSFQVNEIGTANLEVGEESGLEQEERILTNTERLFRASKGLSEILYDGEGAVTEKLSDAESTLAGLTTVDEVFSKWAQDCTSARLAVEEIVKHFQAYVARVEFDPDRLEEIRERLGLISRLKKKYGETLEEVLSFYESAKKDLDTVDNIKEDITVLENEIEKERKHLAKECQTLSMKRREIAVTLEGDTVASLSELGLKNGIFRIDVHPNESEQGDIHIGDRSYVVTARGIDSAEFNISLNPGEDVKPLATVASGGEVSRIMLALKTVLADADEIPMMVFDEIDTGISGRIASVVGRKLKDVSSKHQVVCITHLPQIAAMGDHHFAVEKVVTDGRSTTTVRLLGSDERVDEIAKLLGGETVSEAALQSARELLEA